MTSFYGSFPYILYFSYLWSSDVGCWPEINNEMSVESQEHSFVPFMSFEQLLFDHISPECFLMLCI